MNSYSFWGKSIGIWNELDVLHFALLSNVSQLEELYIPPLTWMLLSWQQRERILSVLWYLGWEQKEFSFAGSSYWGKKKNNGGVHFSFSGAPSPLLCEEEGRWEGLSLKESRPSFEVSHLTFITVGVSGEKGILTDHKIVNCTSWRYSD